MQLFRRTQPPERSIPAVNDTSNPVREAAQLAYQEEKRAFIQHEADRLARLKRIGYDFDLATGRDRSGSH